MNGFPEGYDATFNERISRYLDDPVAGKIKWAYIGAHGSNYNGYIFKKISSKYIIKPSIQDKVMSIGVYIFSFILVYVGYQEIQDSLPLAFVFLGASLFVICGVTYRLFQMKVIIIDENSKLLLEKSIFKRITVQIPFEKMHALQILPVVRSSGDCGFNITFEMNLVLHDANRIFLIELCELNDIRSIAETLSSYIGGIPIWDITR